MALRIAAGPEYLRGCHWLPTGELAPPKPRPWDDCFRDVVAAPRLTWPGVMTLDLRSSCDHWVVYDEPEAAVCVEPQTGPPDAANLAPRVVEPGAPLRATMGWDWAPADG